MRRSLRRHRLGHFPEFAPGEVDFATAGRKALIFWTQFWNSHRLELWLTFVLIGLVAVWIWMCWGS